MKNYSKRLLLVNAFGTLGYFTALLLWGWTGMIYLPMLLENEQVEKLLYPSSGQEPLPTVHVPEVSPAFAMTALVVTAVIMIITVIVVIRIPMTVAKTGKTVTTKAAISALPLITKGRPLQKTEKKRITAQLIKLIKLSLILLPVGIGFIGNFVTLPLPVELAILVSSVLALIALMWFCLQYVFARLLTVRLEQLV